MRAPAAAEARGCTPDRESADGVGLSYPGSSVAAGASQEFPDSVTDEEEG